MQERSSAVYQCNASNEYGYLLANAFVNVLGKKKMLIFFSLLCYSLVSYHLHRLYAQAFVKVFSIWKLIDFLSLVNAPCADMLGFLFEGYY